MQRASTSLRRRQRRSTPTSAPTPADAACGDGFVYEGVEECDDANDVDDDECSNDCTSNYSCLNNPQWQAVDCTTPSWVWSSDNTNAITVPDANLLHVLWTGCSHANIPNTCSLDGTGWVSTGVTAMAGCNTTWYHLGGSYTGQCGGHDGDQVRRLVLNPNDCYAY